MTNSSCKKNDNANAVSSDGPNTWTLNGKTYTGNTVSRFDYGLDGVLYLAASEATDIVSAGQTGNNVGFVFQVLSDTGVKVRVGSGKDRMVIAIGSHGLNSDLDYMSGSSNVEAIVAVNNKKVIVTVPEIWVYNSLNRNDSVRFSANAIAEK